MAHRVLVMGHSPGSIVGSMARDVQRPREPSHGGCRDIKRILQDRLQSASVERKRDDC